GIHVGEQADPATQFLEPGDDRAEPFGVTGEIEAEVGGQLRVAIGHEGGLCRAHCLAQRDETGIARARRRERVALDVEFHAVPANDFGKRMDVVLADVARVRARVHGDAVRAGVEACARGADDVGFTSAAGVAQHGDLVEVDAEAGHGAAGGPLSGLPVAAARRASACSRRRRSSTGSISMVSSRARLPTRCAISPITHSPRKTRAASRQTTTSATEVEARANAKAATASSRNSQGMAADSGGSRRQSKPSDACRAPSMRSDAPSVAKAAAGVTAVARAGGRAPRAGAR